MTRLCFVLVALFALVAIGESEAEASCSRNTEFAPDAGAVVPPNATTYIFPSFSSNVVVRVTSGSSEIEAFTWTVGRGLYEVIAVSPETSGLSSYTIEVSFVADGRTHALESATYRVDAGLAATGESPAAADVVGVVRAKTEGMMACASYDELFLSVDIEAPAYAVEWARSERAYRDGDRQAAIVKRYSKLGNVVMLGHSGCGRNVLRPSEVQSIYVGITPLRFDSFFGAPSKEEPFRIDIDAVPVKSWEAVESMPAPTSRAGLTLPSATLGLHESNPPLEPPPVLLSDSGSAPAIHIAIASVLGLLLGWCTGLVIGRFLFCRRRKTIARAA